MTSARNRGNPLPMFIEKHLRRKGETVMLKLMKYEIRRQVFTKGFIVGVLLALVIGFFGFYFKGEAMGAITIVSLMGLATVLLLFFAPFEFTYTFDKDMNTRQGYMLGLVPRKSTTILVSKLLVALLQSAVLYTLFFTVVPFCERLCESKFGFNPDMVGSMVRGLASEFSGVSGFVEFWGAILTMWLFFACLSMFISAIPGKGKMANVLGIIFFFAAAFLVFFLLEKIDWLLDIAKTPGLVSNIIEWVYIIGVDAALFFGTAKLMEKR